MWDLLREVENLRREFDRAFAGANLPAPWRAAFLPGRGARQYPLVNLHEDREHLYLEAMMPGVDPKTLDISLVGDTLTIAGEKTRRPSNGPVEDAAYHRNERAAGRFVRTVDLPVEIDEATIKADYRDGVLWVSLPKAESAKPRKILVAVAA